MFFGAVIKPGKSHPLVPHADGHALHLSQASLAADVKTGTRASVLVKLGPKEESVIMCTLCAGSQDTVLLDQFMTEYAELSVKGSVPVHITGYFSPEYGPADGDDEGEEEEDEEYGMVSKSDNAATWAEPSFGCDFPCPFLAPATCSSWTVPLAPCICSSWAGRQQPLASKVLSQIFRRRAGKLHVPRCIAAT
jgi:hypothetical protein